MLAYAFHLFDRDPNLVRVDIHPDGEHGKQFGIREWLESRNFLLTGPEGKTSYGGTYSDGRRTLHVSLTPGRGDVVAETEDYRIVAECKGGVINSRHAGQRSRLRKGLCEAVGLLMSRDGRNEQHFAVVPKTDDADVLATRMFERCGRVGIGICLVEPNGDVAEVGRSRDVDLAR